MIVDLEILCNDIIIENDIPKTRSYIDKYFDQSYTYDPSKL